MIYVFWHLVADVMSNICVKKCIGMILGHCSLPVDDQLPCCFVDFKLDLLLLIKMQTAKPQEEKI